MSFGAAAQRAGQRIVRLSRAARSQSKTPKVDAHKASHFKAMQDPPLHPKIGLVANKKEACYGFRFRTVTTRTASLNMAYYEAILL